MIFHSQINEATKIGVWHITEEEDFFLQHVSLQRSITHPHKRLQHLAGRYLLRDLFPNFPLALIAVADTRKPFLEDEAFHFSISHCGDYAAAVVSTENRVGVDIEMPHPKMERIQHKFLSTDELRVLSAAGPANDILTMAWSVKEAMFKWYGDGQVDFIKHMEITELIKTANGFAVRCIFRKNEIQEVQVMCTKVENNFLSAVVS